MQSGAPTTPLPEVPAAQSESRAALAAFVIAARKALGMSQAELASLRGVSQGAVSFWELGKTVPDFETVAELSLRSGVPVPVLGISRGFGADAVALLVRKLYQAERELPPALVSSLKVPHKDMNELAEFLVALEDVVAAYLHRRCPD